MSVRFTSNSRDIIVKNEAFKNFIQAHIALDIETAIKLTAGTPVKTGGMKAEVRAVKNSKGGFRVEAGKSYSAVQEAGQRLSGKGAPTARFSHYSTPGTSAGWFNRAIISVMRNRESYIQEAQRAVGL